MQQSIVIDKHNMLHSASDMPIVRHVLQHRSLWSAARVGQHLHLLPLAVTGQLDTDV